MADSALIYSPSALKAKGVLYRAPEHTGLPTSAKDPLDPLFADQGYIGEKGLVVSPKRTNEKTKDLYGRNVKNRQTEFEVTWKATLLESVNADVLKSIWGDENVEVIPPNDEHGGEIAVHKDGSRLPPSAWVADVLDGGTIWRQVLGSGQITETGDVTFASKEIVEYEVTIEGVMDAEGFYGHDYIRFPKKAQA